MHKSISLYLYGLIIIFEGLFLFGFENFAFHTVKLTLGLGILIGSVFAFLTALSRIKRKIQFSYHQMHALSLMVYGVYVLMYCTSLEMILQASAYLFFFNAFSEIIFCIWLFNLGQTVVYKVVFFRILIGLLTGIGTVISMHYTATNIQLSIQVFAALFMLIGINVMLYVPVMKRREITRSF